MLVVKNTYGVSISYNQLRGLEKLRKLGGSSIDRKKARPNDNSQIGDAETIMAKKRLEKTPALRSMSNRTKSKIRAKIMAFAQVNEKLTFLTLTFVNKVEDRQAIKVLKAFLDNATKRFKDFQYIWVAEKQSNNAVFKNNIHFHLITNKYWPLDKWWNYWLDIQKKHGIVPRDEKFRPGSAMNVRLIKSTNTKGVGTYLTKYVTKNKSQFNCQVWNCSQKISRLYTCFYSGIETVNKFQKLQDAGFLNGEIKTYTQEYCQINVIPINSLVMKFYVPIDEKNKENWNISDQTTFTKPKN